MNPWCRFPFAWCEIFMSAYPQIFRLRQKFARPTVEDIPGEVRRQLASLNLAEQVKPGQSVAITAGSRGIANIAVIIRAAVEYMQSIGTKPFIVPAMGSHGGGTAEGQQEMLAGYNVTEAFCGCPIRASMETVVVCEAAEGFPVHFDRQAYEADHVLVVGRVKPHTKFAGAIESGLMKMMLIGLGKHNGAWIYHAAIEDYSFDQIVRSVAGEVLKKCHILAGLAIIENAYDETAQITAVPADQIERRERELLVQAKEWMPRLPFRKVDILFVDEMGKNISGVGIDANLIGRKFDDNKALENEYPKVRRLVARSLTPESHGNAIGIGLVDFAPQRLMDQIDERVTRINALTSGHVSGAKKPLVYESDRDILDAAIPTIGLTPRENAGILWIRNTLDIIEVECSAVYLEAARERDDLEVISGLRDWPFDAAGNLPASQKAMVGK
jgi:hypothetical protein